jgi:hypothetical protein
MSAERTTRDCLVGLAVALLLVGVVSGTVLRHLVQIAPIMPGLVLLARRPDRGAYAALPIFICWSLIVMLIWSFLLGLSRIANGHYTPLEVASTFVMAGCSVVGVVKSIELGRPMGMMGGERER